MFKKYQRTATAEMRPVTEEESKGFMVKSISISEADVEAGSPLPGDMIARNPKNHKDQWLVAKQYFKDNFKETK